MKKLVVIVSLLLLLTGCTPKFGKDTKIIQQTNNAKEQAIVPYNISANYYRTILPFKEGDARGLITGAVNNRLDINELETGLMRLSQGEFNTDQYYYQEGQYLTKDLILNWLSRKDDSVTDPLAQGLNPKPKPGEKTMPEENRQTPRYLSHILEQNYLIKNKDGKVELGGISIALSLNSVYYYTVADYGYPRQIALDQKEVEAKGKEYAKDIVNRMRQMEGLSGIPIMVALFKEAPRDSVVPGNFMMKTVVQAKQTQIKKWESIDETYVLFPSENAQTNYYNDATKMLNFKSDIDEYFSNYVGVVGRGFYKDGQLQELTINIPIQFYGKAEVIGFTEFVTGKIIDHFPPYIKINTYISSLNQPESVIVREPNSDKPFVHVYK